MKTGYKKQRPPFQAVPDLLLPRLVDEKKSVQMRQKERAASE